MLWKKSKEPALAWPSDQSWGWTPHGYIDSKQRVARCSLPICCLAPMSKQKAVEVMIQGAVNADPPWEKILQHAGRYERHRWYLSIIWRWCRWNKVVAAPRPRMLRTADGWQPDVDGFGHDQTISHWVRRRACATPADPRWRLPGWLDPENTGSRARSFVAFYPYASSEKPFSTL
jgi:hypothetical protein